MQIKEVSYSYGSQKILKNISFNINPNSFTSLIGSSGTGKSTLLKLMCGLLVPASGTITKNHPHESLAYLEQGAQLLPWLTCIENILLLDKIGPKRSLAPLSLRRQKALNLLNEMGLHHTANVYPEALSGGMYQRVCLAKALYNNPTYLLLDEPFSSLDVLIRESLYKTLQKMQKKQKTTILMVTHDFRDALILSDYIAVLKGGLIKKIFLINKENQEENKEQLLREALVD